MPQRRAEETGSLQSVSNALAVLTVLGRHGTYLGVADVARLLNLPRSTAFRLLSTLESHGFTEQEPGNRKYRLGLKLFELAGVIWSNIELARLALPLLEQLSRDTEETVHLVVADRGESVVVEKVDSARAVYVRTHVGSRRPLYCTATGKALFAFFPKHQIEEMVLGGLRRYTASTITDGDLLDAELSQVRRRGLAVNWGEYREDAGGLAAPIRNRAGRVEASVGVAVPIGRLTPQRTEALGPQVVDCALTIARYLGWRPGAGDGVAAQAVSTPL
jgi:DNA-binding IclR family transcriptional regulator